VIRIDTKKLVNLLGDLILTAPDMDGLPYSGVLLHSARGYPDPAEPGETDMLVGTANNGRQVGHTWCAAYGALPPMLWRADDVRAVVTVFTVHAKHDKEHQVDIRRDGNEITIAEDPKLFGETSLSFTALPLDDYPRDLWRVMAGSSWRSELDTDPMPRTDLSPAALATLGKIAKRHGGAPIETYRYHQRRPVLVQIGDMYRGAVMPQRWDSDGKTDAGEAPDSDLYPPVLPDPDEV
jgi:hypothetical protein